MRLLGYWESDLQPAVKLISFPYEINKVILSVLNHIGLLESKYVMTAIIV